MFSLDETYMHRCLELAAKGLGYTQSNPLVGAVLVYDGRIIGEGFHEKFGKPHAEVNCLKSVAPEDRHLIAQATLYVSLEPCNHFGKTPPCTELILNAGIQKVIVATQDSFEKVNGSGLQRLREAGVQVQVGLLEADARRLNKRFFTAQEKKRPYVILKWAQTSNGFMAPKNYQRTAISNALAQRMVHRLRAEEGSILVGSNTALHDNPKLDARLWDSKKNPLRLLWDRHLKVPSTHYLLQDGQPTIVFNHHKEEQKNTTTFIRVQEESYVQNTLSWLQQQGINSVLVEGGAHVLNCFIKEQCWDECFQFTAPISFQEGIAAPLLSNASLLKKYNVGNNELMHYAANQNTFFIH